MPDISICSVNKSTENSGCGNEWAFTIREKKKKTDEDTEKEFMKVTDEKKWKKWENTDTHKSF